MSRLAAKPDTEVVVPMSKEKTQKGRREDILRAALAAYGEKGIFNTRIEEVAAAAGIGKGTIYEYFRSKEDLLSAAVRYEMEELAEQIRRNIGGESTVRGKLKVIVETVMLRNEWKCYRGLDINPANIGSGMKDLRDLMMEQNARWRRWIEEIIDAGVESGEIRQVDSRLFLGALMGTIIHLSQPWDDPVWKSIPPEEISERVADFFLEGMRKRGA